jgi:hypothetical protein
MVIFHSYVSLPEGKSTIRTRWIKPSNSLHLELQWLRFIPEINVLSYQKDFNLLKIQQKKPGSSTRTTGWFQAMEIIIHQAETRWGYCETCAMVSMVK